MIRYSTANRDQLIYKLLRRGKEPKDIKMVLGLGSVDIVYKAMSRYRHSLVELAPEEERRTRHLNLPKVADKNAREKRPKARTL